MLRKHRSKHPAPQVPRAPRTGWAWCLLCFIVPSSAAHADIADLLKDPEAAQTFDYCAWRFADGGTDDALPDFETLLEDEDKRATESDLMAAVLADAGTTVALAASDMKSCQRTFDKGTKAHEKNHAKALKSIGKRARFDKVKDPALAAVQTQVTDLWLQDQAARQVYIGSQTEDEEGASFWARRLAVALATGTDANATISMKKLLEEYDWIDAHQFGANVASHAWILVQHADDHPAFQALALSRMEPYLKNGGVKRSNYAYLWDRVAVNHGREQRYGTQPDWESCENGKMNLQPLEEPDSVDERRATMDLGPMQADLDDMSRAVCPG